jgi:hypothetical protein
MLWIFCYRSNCIGPGSVFPALRAPSVSFSAPKCARCLDLCSSPFWFRSPIFLAVIFVVGASARSVSIASRVSASVWAPGFVVLR